ncbi:MAG TPA: PIG-L family deacetylase [Anaerolineae bacterium]|nr:PIG-L family deacetylase [Anaerolineae bacterium]
MESIVLRQAHSSRRLLVVFPHPDDETFGPGGTIARYAREGVAVHYACATRGEVGSVTPKLLEPFEHLPEDQRLGALREGELRCAAEKLGLTGLHLLGYRDSGMPGAPENRDPRAFVNADPDGVTGQVVQLIRSIQPQVIITFDPFGGYGHPDHIFAHRCAMEAFRAAGDPTRYPEANMPYQPQKLYWTAFPQRWLRWSVRLMPMLGRDPSKFGQNKDIDLRRIVEQASPHPITTRIDVWPYYAIKSEASACHASQAGPVSSLGSLPRWLQRRVFGYEQFTRVEPAVNGNRLKERDLFEGVNE